MAARRWGSRFTLKSGNRDVEQEHPLGPSFAPPVVATSSHGLFMLEFIILLVVILVFAVIRLYLRLTDTEGRMGELATRLHTLEAEQRAARTTASSPDAKPS